MIMALAARPLPPQLTVIEGALEQLDAPTRIRPQITLDLADAEGAWLEVQAVAHEAETFASLTVDVARRIQIAIATGRFGIAGQYAHDLEAAAPRYAHRAKRAELEAQMAVERLHPEGIA